MFLRKTATFSDDNKYFTCVTCDHRLLVWEISSNNVEIDFKLDCGVYGTCTSLHWIPIKRSHASSKQVRQTRRNAAFNDQLLALGTSKGDILLYNVAAKNLYSHLVARHTDSVNDMCFYQETDSFFSCSSDKSIAVWDIMSGKQKSRWSANGEPVSSIHVLDKNYLLSASLSILLWNISKKSIIKRFNGHSTEIFKLLPVNVSMSFKSCYFLSAAISDSKINAWSVSSSDCQTSVASFVPSGPPEDMDISRSSSKDKPLILSVVTKDGFFNLFVHALNGNVCQPLHPKATININAKTNSYQPNDMSVICTKLSEDLESSIIAYGSNRDSVMFKHIKIKELLTECTSENAVSNSVCSTDVSCKVKNSSKLEKNISLNGLTTPSKSSTDKPKTVKLKETSIINSPRKKPKCSKQQSEATSSFQKDTSEKESSKKGSEATLRSTSLIRDSDITDTESSVGVLLKGLQTHNKDMIDLILHNSDAELVNECVKSLPTHTLQCVLEELNSRLRHHPETSSISRKWLKEILKVHLSYLTKCPNTVHILNCIRDGIEVKRIGETISKIAALRSLLSLQIQNTSSDESDSDSEESME